MKSLIIGYGSIGKRHEAVLQVLGHEVHIVSAHTSDHAHRYAALSEANLAEFDYIIIANATADHESALKSIINAGAQCPIMVEKPIFHNTPETLTHLRDYAHPVYVGYHLRFHPVTQTLHRLLADETPLSAAIYTGQHLSTWRPGTNHLEGYSAHASQGGGVLRDLSHELDLLSFLFGALEVKAALNQRVGEVTVDADDSCMALLSSAHCPMMNMHVNYLDAISKRELIINTSQNSFHADYIAGTIRTKDELIECTSHRNDAYRMMHEAVFSNASNQLCTANDGLATLGLIEAIESMGAP